MRCTCCNSVMPPVSRKMKPVTTGAGEMESKHTDYLEGFPSGQEELLCRKCLQSISSSNSDLNEQFNTERDTAHHVTSTVTKLVSSGGLNEAFDETWNEYNGGESYLG